MDIFDDLSLKRTKLESALKQQKGIIKENQCKRCSKIISNEIKKIYVDYCPNCFDIIAESIWNNTPKWNENEDIK
jgi:hypothetical protein